MEPVPAGDSCGTHLGGTGVFLDLEALDTIRRGLRPAAALYRSAPVREYEWG
jgi:hypothetical protein